MKQLFSISILSAAAILGLSSCDKSDRREIIQETGVTDKAFIKVVHAYTSLTPSSATPAAGPSVDVYVNNAKINNVPIGYTAMFPVPAAYAAVPYGLSVNVKMVINRTGGSLPSDTIYRSDLNLAAGSYTTLYLVDTFPNPTPYSPIVLPFGESITSAKSNYYKMRFVNLSAGTDTLEVFSKALNTVVMPGTRFKFASDWVELPLLRRNDTLQLRKPGSTTVISSILTWNPSTERVYTVYARGTTTGTGTRLRNLTSFLNR
jgi:hypothetical protein